MKNLNIKDRLILIAAKNAIRVFVFSTKFGKQTYSKRAIQTVWGVKAASTKPNRGYFKKH